MATPIIYTFSGVGSGSLGSQQFGNSPFAITVLADASTVYHSTGLYPQGATAVDCPVATATISVLGIYSAIFAFGMNITLMNNPENGQFWVSIGMAPDQLLVVKNPALRGYTLRESLKLLAGAGPFTVPKPYPITTSQSLTFTSITSVAFQATLWLPDPPTNLQFHIVSPA